MSISCEIIRDLLPLYLDDVCSNDSKTAVTEHIAACEKCKAELQAMQKDILISKTAQNITEAEAVMNLSKKWKKGMTKSLWTGMYIAILSIAMLFLLIYLLMDIRLIMG